MGSTVWPIIQSIGLLKSKNFEIVKSVKAERVDEPEVVEDQKQTSSVPQSNLEEVDDGEGEEVIQAVRAETPKFFPPKEDSDTQSVQSRKSSSASQKKPPLSPHIKSAPKNQTMNKFDLSMGLKEKPKKKEKKPSGFSKFINMCTGKWSTLLRNTLCRHYYVTEMSFVVTEEFKEINKNKLK